MASNIDHFIEALQHHQFIEAHELLEEDWKAYKQKEMKQEAKAIQGLINGATALALFHIKKREEAYKKVWAVFKKYEPLLEVVHFDEMQKYTKAKELIEEKNKELVEHIK